MNSHIKGRFGWKIALVLVLSMVLMLSVVVSAAPSINDDSNTPKVVDTDTDTDTDVYTDNSDITIDKVDTDSYENEETKDLVDAINDGEQMDVSDYIEKLPEVEGKTDPENFPTTDDYDINLELYDRIIDFYDIEIKDDEDLNDVAITVPETKGMDGADLLVLIIDPDTGEMYIVPLKSFDSETGTMILDLPCDGTFTVVHKVPIVVRNVDPDSYPDQELADIIRTFPDNEVIDCADFLTALGVEDIKNLEVSEGVFVDANDYSSAIALSDVAVEMSRDDFNYDLSTKFKANLYRGNDKVDWERILDYAGVDYDEDAIIADDEELTEFEPIVLEDCFIYHVDASTREVSIIYEPSICWETYGDIEKEKQEQLTQEDIQYFDVDDIDEQNIEDTRLRLNNTDSGTDTDDTSSIDDFLTTPVYADEIESEDAVDDNPDNVAHDEEDVCLVMSGDQYLGMGPFLLFMPKEGNFFTNGNFPWWILILLAIIILFYIWYRNHKKKQAAASK